MNRTIRRKFSPYGSYKPGNAQAGFTLIELIIVVAIIGIISAVAFPSYTSYMKKSRRADAKIALTKMADAQERWYLQNSTYTSTVANVGGADSPDGYYTMAITSADVNAYVMSATAKSDGAQADDTQCEAFVLSSLGTKTATGSTGDQSKCW